MYVCVCVCVCVCVQLRSSFSFKHVWLNNQEYFLCIILLRSFKIPDKCHGFRLELVDEFTEIVSKYWAWKYFVQSLNIKRFFQTLPMNI